MNTIVKQFFATDYNESDDAILMRHKVIEPGLAPVCIPIEAKAIGKFESIMRRHAAAGEAGQ